MTLGWGAFSGGLVLGKEGIGFVGGMSFGLPFEATISFNETKFFPDDPSSPCH